MKNINKYIALFFGAAALWSCDPLEDEIKELEEAAPAPIDNLTITLEDDDYELAIIGTDTSSAYFYKSFSSIDDVKQFVPVILAENYPVLGSGSFADVTYAFYQGSNAEASAIGSADEYELVSADYESISLAAGESGFLNQDAKSSLPEILAANIDDAEEGDIAAATFEFADVDYAGETLHNTGFTSDLDSYTGVSVSGDDQEWFQNSYQSSTYANMSGYDDGAQVNEDWLVSPVIDLSSYADQNIILTVDQTLNYLGDLNTADDINIFVSDDYSGDVGTATWTAVDLSSWPAGSDWDPVVGTADISDMAGGNLYIGFKYVSDASDAPNWQINDVSVDFVQATDASTEDVTAYFEFDGSAWEEIASAYALKASDYDAMGDGPGRYNNFSSSVEPDDYLPQFLTTNFPYAQEADEMVVTYYYYDGSSTGLRAEKYYFVGSTWAPYTSTIDQTLSFGHDGSTWVPDNTITVTFTSTQWAVITSLEGGDRGDNVSQYSSFYQGSNTTGGTWWSDEEIEAVLIDFLNDQYGDMEEGQKYLLNYDVYIGSGAYDNRSELFIKEGDTYVKVVE